MACGTASRRYRGSSWFLQLKNLNLNLNWKKQKIPYFYPTFFLFRSSSVSILISLFVCYFFFSFLFSLFFSLWYFSIFKFQFIFFSPLHYQILKHEGAGSLYRALPPRLFAVVPMIGEFSSVRRKEEQMIIIIIVVHYWLLSLLLVISLLLLLSLLLLSWSLLLLLLLLLSLLSWQLQQLSSSSILIIIIIILLVIIIMILIIIIVAIFLSKLWFSQSLLGFIYLACRLQRSWILPADIVRWCLSGKLTWWLQDY